MSHEVENPAEKQTVAPVEKAAEKISNEAVHDAFGKGGNEGTFKRESTVSAANEAAKKALPELELTNAENSKQGVLNDASKKAEAMKELQEMRKDPNGKGGGGKIENSKQGVLGDSEKQAKATKELEEMRKDPNGKGGGGRIENEQKGLPGGDGGRIDRNELQQGGPSAGGGYKGEEMHGTKGGGSVGKAGRFEDGVSKGGRLGESLGAKAGDSTPRVPTIEPKDVGAKDQNNNLKDQALKGLLQGEKKKLSK